MAKIESRKTALRGCHEEIYITPNPLWETDLEKCNSEVFPLIIKIIKDRFRQLPRGYGLRLQLRIFVKLEKYSFEQQRHIRVEQWFPSDSLRFLSPSHLIKKVQTLMSQCLARYDSFVQTGSGWVLQQVNVFSLAFMRFPLFSGGCKKTRLPAALTRSKVLLAVPQSDANLCFVYAVVLAVFEQDNKNPTRNCKTYQDLVELLPDVIKHFPVTLKEIIKFEKNSPFSFNIYGYERVLFPFYITDKLKTYHINLLLHKNHYYVIKDLGPLIKKNFYINTRKCFVCNFCLTYFTSKQNLERHSTMCFGKGRPIEMPEYKDRLMSFNNFSNLLPAPFVIYADLESSIDATPECLGSKPAKQISKKRHRAISFACLTVCRSNPMFSSHQPVLYTGPDAIQKFFNHLQVESVRINRLYETVNIPLQMTIADQISFQAEKRCHFCLREFDLNPYIYKVRDHCHLSGKYRFALCSRCNLTFAKTKPRIVVLLHGLCNYDSHFIINELHQVSDKYLKVIPRTGEKYLSFSVGEVIFKDSFQFLSESLATLASNLQQKGLDSFANVNRYVPDEKWRKLMMQKGVFPYTYITDLNVLKQTSLPAKEYFFNDLIEENISEESYQFAQQVWDSFQCQTLKDYLHIYLLADLLLLADVFENFRSNCLDYYELDPIHYFSSAHYTFDAFLRYSALGLELLTDPNMYLFFSKGIRGGLSMVSAERWVEANNKDLKDFNPDQESTYLLYLDCNNLYGKAMMEPLPYADFKWEKVSAHLVDTILWTPLDADRGYVLEVTFVYPPEIHDDHQDYPLAPEKLTITHSMLSPFAKSAMEKDKIKLHKTEKLLATLYGKERYVLHYRVFQLYIQLGLKVEKVHNIISFKQAPIMKEYISFNSKKRAEATNDFDVGFYKLLCNSLFGKTMERPENKSKVKLVNKKKTFEQCVSKLTFKNCKVINSKLVGIEMSYPSLKISKPFYLGMVILDLSKYFMYNFHYNTMKKYFQDDIKLIYTDTDSLVYKIKSKDINVDLQKLQSKCACFDFSNYSPSHILFDKQYKRVPGLFKDECKGQILKSFVGLRSKMYCLKVEDIPEMKVAKGVKKNIIKNKLRYEDYVDCLQNYVQLEHDFRSIRSFSHSVFTMHQKKISLSPYDDKRYLLDSLHSLPYGHKDIERGEEDKNQVEIF